MRKTILNCRAYKLIAVVLFTIGATACGGGGSSSGGGTDDSSTVQLSGNWVGHVASSIHQGQGDIRVTMNQSGTNVNGTINITNLSLGPGEYTCSGSPDFTGSIQGNNLTIELGTTTQKTEISATATSNKISGNYRTVGGPCSGDRGTITLARE